MKRRLISATGAAVAMLVVWGVMWAISPHASGATRQNVVVILTDDQRIGSLSRMPNVEADLVAKGYQFTENFDNNPLCCPSRVTLMTGQTSGHNGVWWNQTAGGVEGGYRAFRAHVTTTLFSWMHDAGYRTAMIGKFLNGYNMSTKDYKWVMPGVDEWDAFMLDGGAQNHPPCNKDGYWATCYSHNGALETHGPSEYSAVTSGDKAVSFIESTPAGQPLFMYYAPRAPHAPTTPDTKYAKSCSGLANLRPPSYNTAIVNGPRYTQRPPFDAAKLKRIDTVWKRSCQSLLSTDDQVGRIVAALGATGRLDNTLILFASDNGLLFGEHIRTGKLVPYEESDRVPLVIRDDALGSGGVVSSLTTNMDYTATIMDLAGVSAPSGYQIDGESLAPLIGGPGVWTPHDGVLVEHDGGAEVPGYCGVRTQDWLFVRYTTGEEELYDVASDPYQLVNVVAQHPAEEASLLAQTRAMCVPGPVGW